ncbi:MAG: hypothetical protein L6Q95_00635 [Planctomycetes bacterium]|nr:hypothetical protein [Planctomycetota bacterium]
MEYSAVAAGARKISCSIVVASEYDRKVREGIYWWDGAAAKLTWAPDAADVLENDARARPDGVMAVSKEVAEMRLNRIEVPLAFTPFALRRALADCRLQGVAEDGGTRVTVSGANRAGWLGGSVTVLVFNRRGALHRMRATHPGGDAKPPIEVEHAMTWIKDEGAHLLETLTTTPDPRPGINGTRTVRFTYERKDGFIVPTAAEMSTNGTKHTITFTDYKFGDAINTTTPAEWVLKPPKPNPSGGR